MCNSNTSSRQLVRVVSAVLNMAYGVLTDDDRLVTKWLRGSVNNISETIGNNPFIGDLSSSLTLPGTSVEIAYGETSGKLCFEISIRDLISGDPFDTTRTMFLCPELIDKANNTIGLVGFVTSDDPAVATTLWIPAKDFTRVSRIIKDVIGDTFVISAAPMHMTVTDNNYSLKLRFEVERRA